MIEQRAQEILQKHFHHSAFRNGQVEIISSVIQGKDTLVVMPTGGGKSLCYQIPAMLSQGTALVISPLIALMKDQVDALHRARIPATFINSSLHFNEIQQRITNARYGAYKLLYVAPERLESKQFIEQLGSISLSFLAVDEAHCISEWGHDFRPSYLNIPTAMEQIQRLPVIALTATATTDVQDDIIRALKMQSPECIIRGFDRPNLRYRTELCAKKPERAVDIIKQTPIGSTIIYCGSRKKVEESANALMRYGIQAEAYHAGMPEQVRTLVQENFVKGATRVLVATSAFGMGVDKSDVRNVLHFDLTPTLEAYYQEAGRAGRDGKESSCFMLYQPSDRKLQEFFISATYPDLNAIRAVYTFLYDTLNAGRGVKPQQPLYMDDVAIGGRIQLPAVTVSSVLNLLERNGILRRGSTQGMATIQLSAERPRLREYFNNTTPERKIVLESLLRSIGSHALESAISVDVQAIIRKHDIPYDQFTAAMRAFEYARLLRYEPAASAGGLTMLLERLPLNAIPVDYEALTQRREHAQMKLDVVQRYAETTECKRNYILSYFQEDDIQGNCGRCSSCMQPSAKKVHRSEQEEYAFRHILEAVAELNGRFGRTAVAQVLIGNASTKVKLFALDQSRKFGSLKEFSQREVMEYIDAAIQQRLLMLSSGLHPTVLLAPSGKKILGSDAPKPMDIVIPQRSVSEVTPIVKRLIRMRDELAARYNTGINTIASDEQLREIAIHLPRRAADFSRIRGLGEMFMSRWAKDFLRVLRDESAVEEQEKQEAQLKPTVVTTLEFLRKGNSVEKIAELRLMAAGTIAQHIQEAVERGVDVPQEYLFSNETYAAVRKVLHRRPRALLKDLRAELGAEYDYALLRVVTAFVRRDMAMREEG